MMKRVQLAAACLLAAAGMLQRAGLATCLCQWQIIHEDPYRKKGWKAEFSCTSVLLHMTLIMHARAASGMRARRVSVEGARRAGRIGWLLTSRRHEGHGTTLSVDASIPEVYRAATHKAGGRTESTDVRSGGRLKIGDAYKEKNRNIFDQSS
jgi:hypothetical protein